jgi:hypothetical protein
LQGLEGLKQSGRGASGEEADKLDVGVTGFEGGAFVGVEGFESIIPAFDINVGLGLPNDLNGPHGGENGHSVDATESGEDVGAVGFAINRAIRAFELADGIIAIDGDEEDVTTGAGGLEVLDMAGVEEVEAAIGQDEAAPGLALGFPPGWEGGGFEDGSGEGHGRERVCSIMAPSAGAQI